jgi:methionyl-tRNA formyltransferase
MKIVIVTQNAPMYLASFLDNFLSKIGKTSHVVKNIVVFPPYFRDSVLQEIRDRYNYYGFTDFIRMVCHIMKNMFLSFIFNIYPFMGCYSVNNIIKKYKIERYKTDTINSKDFIEYIKTNRIDLIVSIASPKIFKKEILTAPRKGCINYHTALLPRYRGRQPLFWALLNEEKDVGISIHKIDEKLDNGPIIIQKKIPVDSKDSLHSLYLKTIKIGPMLLMEAIEKLDDNDYKDTIENNSREATYNSFPTKKDAKLFKSQGKRFF